MPLPRYQYKVIQLTDGLLQEKVLNQLGQEGWLLLTTYPQAIFARIVGDAGGWETSSSDGKTPQSLPMLLRVAEVCTQLGISRSKVYELIRSDSIQAVRIGKSVRIPRDSLNKFLK